MPKSAKKSHKGSKPGKKANQLIQNYLGARCVVLGVRESRSDGSDGHSGSIRRLWVRYPCGLEAPLEGLASVVVSRYEECSAVEQVQMELVRLRQSYKELKPFKVAKAARKVSVQPKGKGKSKPGTGSGASGKSKTAGKKKK